MMKRHWRFILLLVLATAFFQGCATKTAFVYVHPEVQPESQSEVTVAYGVEDLRESHDMDKVYKEEPMEEITKIIQEELLSTGLFKQVVLIPGEKSGDGEYLGELGADVEMRALVKELKWEVPDYDAILAKTFAFSLLGGLVGGLIYGSTSTDVYGDTVIAVTVTDVVSGETYIDKEYVSRHEESMAKLNCDLPKTKARMVGTSLKKCMDELKADLQEAVKRIEEGKVACCEAGI